MKFLLFTFITICCANAFFLKCDDFNECTSDMLVERKCVHVDYDVLLQKKCDSGCGNGGNDGYCDSGKCIPFKPCTDCVEDEDCGEIHLDFLDREAFSQYVLHQMNICVLNRCQYYFLLENENEISMANGRVLCNGISSEQNMDCNLMKYQDDKHVTACKCRKL